MRWRFRAILRRALVAVLVIVQTGIATYYMLAILPYHGSTAVEKALAGLFALLFGWITAAFWTAILGFVVRRGRGGDRLSLVRRHPAEELATVPVGRTAVIMPIYHEPVDRALAGLEAVYRSLAGTGELDAFDFFILSDSRHPLVWLSEQQAWHTLCERLGAAGRLYYRRRVANLHYKSGNIGDFLRRWGRDYEYMVVLDADSLMAGATIVEMVRLMALEPQVGILQTNPAIVNARSAFARAQQFANRVYGPLFASGLAAMMLGEAAYWGHNAAIRIRPFMRLCGLPQLSGFGLFSGPILSHDFVEAAYMSRGGHEVWLEPELGGSFEESPPSLIDELTRDRRWAKGNLQHLWLLVTGRRFRFAHRMTFLNGILAYGSSLLWLAFLVLAAIEVARFTLWPINYFPSPHQLFPLWPEWHPEWAIRLAGSTVIVLVLPKLLAMADLVLRRRQARYGGSRALLGGIGLEFLISVLLAPIRMLAHSRYVVESLLGVSLSWAGQNRSVETSWPAAIRRHAPGTVVAALWGGFALWLKPLYFLWSLPVVAPLVLAAPISVLLSRVDWGDAFAGRGLLVTPSDREVPEVVEAFRRALGSPLTAGGRRAFERAVVDPVANSVHVAAGRARRAQRGRLRRLAERCFEHGPEALSRDELDRLAQDAETMSWLHRQAWRSPPASYWGRRVDRDPVDRSPRSDPP